MSFSGKYELQSQENYEAFMKALGVPDDVIQMGKGVKTITEIVEKGDNFKVTVTSGPKVFVNNFTIGQESELQTFTGDKIKTVVRRDGNKLKVQLKEIFSVTELVDKDTLVSALTLGNIVYKDISKRM